MKNRCTFFQYSFILFSLVFLNLSLLSTATLAQQLAGAEEGRLRIKVSEELAAQIEGARMTRTLDNVVLTGISSIDNVNVQFKVNTLKRVFRPAGKFEAKHRQYGLHRWYEIRMDNAASVLAALSAFGKIDQVEIAEPVYKKAIVGSENKNFGPVVFDVNNAKPTATLPGTSNDPLLANQWHYNNTSQTGGTAGADVSLLQAWALETGSSDVIVAVTDGGIQTDHPDLVANMWINENEIPGNGIDDDNNGYVDDIYGYGFGDDTGDIAPDAHGTHVGGTVAATTNNGIGVAGVAGGSGVGDGVRLMSCAAFGANGTGGFAETYVYGADMGAIISQNSWGYTNPGAVEQAVLDGIDYFIAEAGKDEFGNQVALMNGGLVLVAAGNSNSNNSWYPGFYEPTIAVAGTTHNDTKAWYSNFGPWVDISAPGGETNNVAQQGVLSTLSNSQYGFFQGTSMACPHASGVAALIISLYGGPGFTPDMVRSRIEDTTDDIDALNPSFVGMLGTGRINAFTALQQDDETAPEAIDDLAAEDVGITEVTLTWTSPVDTGNGSASVYDIRYSTSPINEGNFGDATAVLNPPAPQPAGSEESYTITDLSPGTTYFFAIKSADFFGNVSDISNVVEQSTNLPPVIAVSPASMTASLQTAGTSTQSLSISNTGAGPLDFVISFSGTPEFASAIPLTGSVAAGGTTEVSVVFNASGLFGGTYEQVLTISSNDPATSELEVPLTLNVTNNDAPIASVSPDSIDFGSVFEGGTVEETLIVHNAGSDTLTVSGIVSNNPYFTADFTGPVDVGPFGDLEITVTFAPLSVGPASGELTIATNDPANPEFIVALSGTGTEAPAIVVSPDSFSESLNTDRTSTQTLSITNSGGSNLQYAIEVAASETASVATTKKISLPPATIGASGNGKASASTTFKSPSSVTLKSVGTTAAVTQVLIITPDEDVTDLSTILNGFADVEADVYPQLSLPSITLADLVDYDVVMTTNNTQWLEAGSVDPAVIGDLLADYIDQGGKVIVNQFAYSYDDWKMDGRFITEQYGPFTPSTTDANIDISLGTILEPGHPVMAGVSSLDYSGFVQDVGLAPGATALANWANGELLIAVNSNVVALNLLPSLGNGDPLQWEGDLPTIYQNAIHFLGGPSFVSVSPGSGTVAPGETTELEVTFDATGLDEGTYLATIGITTNVPGQGLISIPAELEVLGPEFIISPTSLSEELPQGGTSTQVLVITNNGPESRPFEITVENTGAISVSRISPASTVQAAASRPTSSGRNSSSARQGVDLTGKQAIPNEAATTARSGARVAQSAVSLYSTDFENFAEGDIHGQNGWAGQFGNWTIETTNPAGGNKHFRGLADGLGQSLSFSPAVAVGSDSISTTTMRLNVTGTGVTWQIIPQSPSAGFVCTRVQFSPDGSAQALVDDGAGNSMLVPIPAAVPAGYFSLTIQMQRSTGVFDVLFDGSVVFTGQGFAGDIEQVVILSLMEVSGPTFDIDNFKILDGEAETIEPFVSVSPVSGTLASGESLEIMVNFDAGDLAFGEYTSDIVIDFDVEQFVVPASLRVFGDPTIEVDPTLLQVQLPYKGDTIRHFEIKNTGGNPLNYSLQVLGAATSKVGELPETPVGKFASWEKDSRITDKLAEDNKRSRPIADVAPASVQIMAGTALLEEHFEGGTFPPAGWNVVDNEGTGLVWGFAADHSEGNYAGTGEAATASSDAAGSVEFDTELQTPVINVTGFKNVAVQYNANYHNYANFDFLDLDIMVEGSASWTTILSWNEDHGTFRGAPGEFVTVELDDYLAGATSFKLRWHYYDPNTGDWDWYAQIDDVVVLGDPRAWLSVSPVSGTVPVGESVDITTYFDAEDLDPGFYVAAVLVNSNAVNEPLVGVFNTLTVLEPAEIQVSPDTIYQELLEGETATQEITIANTGVSPLNFSIGNLNIPTATGEVMARKEATQTRTSPVELSFDRYSTAAIINADPQKLAATELYATGFEEFAPGDIDAQEGWSGQYGNWTIEGENPFAGTQHFRGLSDGLGQSRAFSPVVSIGTDSISSTTMKMSIEGTDVTWQIIPQSPTAQLVITRFEISPDGTAAVLVSDGAGGGFYDVIPAAVPAGYFDLRIDVTRNSSVFTVYFNDEPVYSGQGFAGDIEQIVVLSLMEVAGPVFDIDNFAILDGEPQAPWLTVFPKDGIIPSGGQQVITLQLSAEELEKGVYEQYLNIMSNDPASSQIVVPVTLKVDRNVPPVIAAVSDTSVVETGLLELTFTATDEDDSLVNVTLVNAPAFVSMTSQGNGYATFLAKPKLGDRGDYYLSVVAQDARGKKDSVAFTLTVHPYGVQNFSLLNLFTGEEVSTFADTTIIDVADPDYYKYIVRANTAPADVPSVLFKVDGKKKNVSNNAPHILNPLVLLGLDKGDHTLEAETYAKKSAKGAKISVKVATITVVNSVAVTGFNVVDRRGNSLIELFDGAVIDIKDPMYKYINITADVSSNHVGSLKFELNGRPFSVDNLPPYSMAGDLFGYFLRWNAKAGHYKLVATPYSLPFTQGVAGESLTIEFDVVYGAAVASKGNGQARRGEGGEIGDEEPSLSRLQVYPVPTADVLNVKSDRVMDGDVQLLIHDVQGRVLFQRDVKASMLNEVQIDLNKIGISKGVYYIYFRDGKSNVVRRFIKQ